MNGAISAEREACIDLGQVRIARGLLSDVTRTTIPSLLLGDHCLSSASYPPFAEAGIIEGVGPRHRWVGQKGWFACRSSKIRDVRAVEELQNSINVRFRELHRALGTAAMGAI